MKKNKLTFIFTFAISLLLFILTFSQFGKLFEILLPDLGNTVYQENNINSQFRIALSFSIILSLTPILLLITWKIAPITYSVNKLYSVLISVVIITLVIVFRKQTLTSNYSQLLNLKTQRDELIKFAVSIENLNYEYFLLGGLLISCVLSYFILKDKVNLKFD